MLAIALQGRTAARHTINGLACAIGLVTLLAVLSRLHPQGFPANDHLEFLGEGSARKLSCPLSYWNALAAFAAIGVPLLLGLALGARTLLGQALAAAALPVSALCVYLTISRGGALALGVGIVAFLLFVPAPSGRDRDVARRRHRVGDPAGRCLAARRRPGRRGHHGRAPAGDGAALAGADRLRRRRARAGGHWSGRPPSAAPRVPIADPPCIHRAAARRPGCRRCGGDRRGRAGVGERPVAGVQGTGRKRRRGGADNVFSRLSGVSGNGRDQYWQSALDANATAPWKGIGPGTFEFWWARNGLTSSFIRDAHTLYFETLAESGIVGFVLLVGLLAFLLVAARARSLRATPELRIWIAAAVGGLAAFLTSAAFE